MTKLATRIPHLAEASAVDRMALEAQTAKERMWYKNHESFGDYTDIQAAVSVGRLAFVGIDANIAPIARLREPAKAGEFPPFLLPESKCALAAVGQMWRVALERQHDIVVPELRLAATSFVRTEERQAELVADSTILASSDSTHTRGGPFDLDASGYYWLCKGDTPMKVSHPERNNVQVTTIGEILGGDENRPTAVAPVEFQTEVTGALIKIVQQLHEAGMANVIYEFPGTSNACLHVAPNPEVTLAEWDALAA